MLKTRPPAGIARSRLTRGAGEQDAGKIARALLRLQFERFDWNSATGFETSLLPDLSQVDGTAIAQDISVERCVAFVLRDRDRIFGYEFVQQLTAMGVAICLDHVIVFNEAILAGETSRHLQSFGSRIIAAEATWAYRRTPDPRPVQPPGPGRIIASREVSGLNYRYELRASCRLIDPCL